MKIFNSLSRQVEEFQSINKGRVGMYTCGPTVYSFVTIGNWRTYFLGDLLVRSLKFLGYEVDYVMNITDVGHLTGDNLGDADTGDDRLEKAAVKEGRTAWEIAKFYTDDFYQGYGKLNLTRPKVWCKATEHINEQIMMIKAIEAKGFSYQTSDGIYFDTQAYEAAGNKYGQLSTLSQIVEGARVEVNPEKRDPRDFALWKFSPSTNSGLPKRHMEWESPWGVGFPGWHIECSAMSQKYLGDQFDIHVGGEDLRSTHHPNEIAQAEAATGKKPFVKYWIHGSFLLIDGGRMGKSLGNAYRIDDLEAKGFDPMDLRYFYFSGHYRKQLNFTWDSLQSARNSLLTLKQMVNKFRLDKDERTVLSGEKLEKVADFSARFKQAIEDDLNMPMALSVVWEMVKSNIPSRDKYEMLVDFDQVLGFGVGDWQKDEIQIPQEVQELANRREVARKQGDYKLADELRNQIEDLGYKLLDTPKGVICQIKKA